MTALKQPWINDILPFYAWWYENVTHKNLQVKVKRLQVKDTGLFSAYGLLLPPGINWLSQLCVKSTNPITVYKCLKKNYYELTLTFYFEEKKGVS